MSTIQTQSCPPSVAVPQAPAWRAVETPADVHDFVTIDSPVKAALLPITEPAFQASLAFGFMTALQASASGSPGPLVTLDVCSRAANHLMHCTYYLDMQNTAQPLTGQGDVDGLPLQDAMHAPEQVMEGRIGQNATHLDMTGRPDDTDRGLDGTIGSVPVHLKFSNLEKGSGFHTEGSLGGQPFKMDMAFAGSEAGLSLSSQSSMQVRGSLGDAEISKDYKILSQKLPDGAQLTFSGTGTTAGVPQDVWVTMRVSS